MAGKQSSRASLSSGVMASDNILGLMVNRESLNDNFLTAQNNPYLTANPIRGSVVQSSGSLPFPGFSANTAYPSRSAVVLPHRFYDEKPIFNPQTVKTELALHPTRDLKSFFVRQVMKSIPNFDGYNISAEAFISKCIKIRNHLVQKADYPYFQLFVESRITGAALKHINSKTYHSFEGLCAILKRGFPGKVRISERKLSVLTKKNSPYVHIKSPNLNSKETTFLIDTGCELNLLKISALKDSNKIEQNYTLLSGVGEGTFKTLGRVSIDFGSVVGCNMHLVPDDFSIPCDGLLGIEFLRNNKATLCFETGKLLIPSRSDEYISFANYNANPTENSRSNDVSDDDVIEVIDL